MKEIILQIELKTKELSNSMSVMTQDPLRNIQLLRQLTKLVNELKDSYEKDEEDLEKLANKLEQDAINKKKEKEVKLFEENEVEQKTDVKPPTAYDEIRDEMLLDRAMDIK